MDILLPSGVTLKDVPDGLSDEQVKTGAIEQGIAKETDFLQKGKVSKPDVAQEQPENPQNGPSDGVSPDIHPIMSLDEAAAKYPLPAPEYSTPESERNFYAQIATEDFFVDRYNMPPNNRSLVSKIGEKIYGEKLKPEALYNNLVRDNESGALPELLTKAKYSEYGVTGPKEFAVRNFLDSPKMDMAKFYGETLGKGFTKAVADIVTGAGALVLPKKLEDAVGLDRLREEKANLSKYQMEDINQELLDGNYGRYISKTTGMVLGDTFGNLMLMKQGLSFANKLSGGKLTLIQKQKKWKEAAKNTALRSSIIAGMNFIKTDGTLEDRWDSSMLTFVYMNTPVLSSLAKTNLGAIISDTALNSVVSGLYDPEEGLQIGGQYKGLVQESKDLADEIGDPDSWKALFVAKLIPIAGPDIIFGALSRSARANQRTSDRSMSVESARLMKPFSDQSFDRLKANMGEKYGTDWIKNMDDLDRVSYENMRRANTALDNEKLPPAMEEIEKRFTPRVNPSEMGRIIEPDVTPKWRDEKGRLVEETISKPIENEEQAKSEAERLGVKFDYFRVIEDPHTGEKMADSGFTIDLGKDFPTDTRYPSFGLEKGETLKQAVDRVREKFGVDTQIVPDKPIDESLKDLERSMESDKRTEVISTDADIGTGRIQESMRTGQKASTELAPPRPTEDLNPWIEKQIIFVSRLMEMGLIETKSDYKEVLDSYTQRGDVDSNMIYKEAQKHKKTVKKTIDAAEKKSKKAKVTQAIFRREKQMVLVDSMEIIKDRLRAVRDSTKLGKKLGVEQQKNKQKAIDDLVDAGVKIVKELSPDKKTRDMFTVKAQRLRTEAGLNKFIPMLSEYVKAAQDKLERNKLVSAITEKPTENTAAEYTEGIQDLQDMILTDTGKKTAWRLEQQRDALSRNPDLKLPKKVLDNLKKTKIDDISTEDLRAISTEVKRLKDQGKVVYKLRERKRRSENRAYIKNIKSTAKEPKDVSPIVTSEKQKYRFKGLRKVMYTGALRPWNLVDILDGGKAKYDGVGHNLFINKANDAYSSFLAMNDARIVGGEAVIRASGMSAKELTTKTAKINGKKITLDDLLSVYASSKNRLMHNAVLYGNFKGDVDAYNKAVQTVEDNAAWKRLADYIVYDYANNFGRVRKAFIRNENSILGNEENYVPMVRESEYLDREPTIDEIKKNLLERDKEASTLPGKNFTIDRLKIDEKYQTPIKLGLYDQWEKSVQSQERYINLFGQVRSMKDVLSDVPLRQQLKGAYGEDYLKALDNYVESYGNPHSIYDNKGIAPISRKFRRSITTGYLAYNVMTMGKQIPSILLYLGQGGGKNMLTAMDDFNGGWRVIDGKIRNNLIDFVNEKDPQIKHAHIERELGEMKMSDKGMYEKITAKIGAPGMKGIIAFDKAVRTIGWYSTYMKALESGKSDSEAITAARNATLRTQPAASAKDLPDLYKSGEGFNWPLMFSNQLNQLWNLSVYQFPRSAKDGDWGAVAGITAGLIANAVVMDIMTHKRIPSDEEEFIKMIVEQSAGKVPLLGSTLSQGLQGRDAQNPAMGLVSDSAKAAIRAAQDGDEEAYAKALTEIIENAGTATGVPVITGKRILKTIGTGDPTELLGAKPKKKKKIR